MTEVLFTSNYVMTCRIVFAPYMQPLVINVCLLINVTDQSYSEYSVLLFMSLY